jgi:hypothetical protein
MTTSARKPSMDMSTWKYKRKCTDCRRLVSQPTNYSKHRLACHRYFEQPHTPGLWKYVSRPIWFNLCVDYFGIKYIGKDYPQHLYDALQKEKYDIVEDLKGNLYCGITFRWDYLNPHVDLNMEQYVMKQLTSEVQNKMIYLGHQILSCHVLVVRSFFILWKILLSSQNLPYDHLLICTNITFQYPKK